MKHARLFVILLPVLWLQIFFIGCKTDSSPTTAIDPTSSKQKSDQAYQMVENEMMTMINGHFNSTAQFDQLKFSSALSLYNDALALNPDNTDAEFGAAFTEMLSAYSDPDMNTLVKNIDSSAQGTSGKVVGGLINTTLLPSSSSGMSLSTAPAAAGIIFSIQTALKDPPLISKVQSVLSTSFLPRVQRAIDHLSKLDKNESFKFTITGKMQGDASLQPVTIYTTEVALMNAMMNFLKFNIQSMLIYKFDLTDYKQATLISALSQSNNTFFVLQSDGQQRAASAKASFDTTITKLQMAIDYLKRISGSKSDAIIKLGNNGIRQSDLDTVSTYLTKLKNALSSDVSVTIENGDSDGNSYTIKVNIGNFMTNPVTNPKQSLLPAYTVSAKGTNDIQIKFNAATYADFTFPDPTMGGLFPGMAQETLKRLMHVDENYQFEMQGWIQVLPYYNNSYNPLYGSVVSITSNGTAYTATVDYWGNYDIKVKNVTTTPQPVTKFSIWVNGAEMELANINSNSFAGVQAKQYIYCPIMVTLPPKNLNVAKQSSSSVFLSWTTIPSYPIYYWQNYYMVQRKTGTGSYGDISVSANYSSFSGYDNGLSTGVQYYYRVRSLSLAEFQSMVSWYGDVTLVPKAIMYSNEVNITL
jgi:hypothetical protein